MFNLISRDQKNKHNNNYSVFSFFSEPDQVAKNFIDTTTETKNRFAPRVRTAVN